MANELERSKRIIFSQKHEDDINPKNLKLLEKYEMDMEIRELSPKSIYNYKRDLIQWMSYLNREQFNIDVTEVTEDEIEEFIFYCKKQGNNTERIKRRFSSISAFYIFLRKKKIIKENPMEFIDRPKKGRPVVVQTFLTPNQVEDIRNNLKELNDLQLTTYVELSLATMARVNAVSNITWAQIDLDNYIIEDVLEKEGKIVTLYFDERVKSLLIKLKEERNKQNIECDYVFISKRRDGYRGVVASTLGKWTKKIGATIDIPTLHPHDWRHSGATLRKNAGMELETISSLLSHSGIDVTKNHYIKEDSKKMGETFRSFTI